MCLHSQAKTNPQMSLIEGIKHDLRASIDRVDISGLSDEFLESESLRMKKISWTTLRTLIKPPLKPKNLSSR